jgi:glutamate-1-semialdehyde 2,1-aminomutase
MSVREQAGTRHNDYYARLKERGEEIVGEYRALTPTSQGLFKEAAGLMPGGYTRDAVMRTPHPLYLRSGAASLLRDADGREIIDFWFNATSLILGHCHPAVTAAVREQLDRGAAFYGPTDAEFDHARALIARIPCAERVRYANSGSEAVMMALRIARAFTGRSTIAKFEGSYHGSYDDIAWSVAPPAHLVGSLDAPVSVADTAGLAGAAGRALVLPFNDLERATRLVEANAETIAAIIVEPMSNRIGMIMPDVAFVQGLRRLCDRFGIVLIFDEVIAFRVAYGGAQSVLGVTPDMTTLGKIIGGGFPVGAVVGRAKVLEVTAPTAGSRVTHAGTFNANPITLAAGKATLNLLTSDALSTLNARGQSVRDELADICSGLPLRVTGAGSLFKISATGEEIRNYRNSVTADRSWEGYASLELLNRGFLLTPQLQGCLSMVTTDTQIERLLDAIRRIVKNT